MTPPPRIPWIIVSCVAVQIALLDRIRIEGTSPNIVFALAAVAGLLLGAERGALVGFAAGVLLDLTTTAPLGLSALAATLVGYVVGTLQSPMVRMSWWVPVGTVAIGGATGTLLYASFAILVGRPPAPTEDLMVAAMVVGALNSAAAPILVAAVRDSREVGSRGRIRAQRGW